MNYFVVVTKTENGKFNLVMDGERLPIFNHKNEALKYQLKHSIDAPFKRKHVVRKINKNELLNLIK